MFYSENDRYSRSFFSDRHYTSESLCCLLLVYILYIPLSNIYMGYLVYIRVETLVRETATSLWWNLCPHKTFSHTDVIVSLVENVYPQYPINQVQIKNKKTHTHTNMSSWPHTHTHRGLFVLLTCRLLCFFYRAWSCSLIRNGGESSHKHSNKTLVLCEKLLRIKVWTHLENKS